MPNGLPLGKCTHISDSPTTRSGFLLTLPLPKPRPPSRGFLFPAQAATTLASLWPGAGATSGSEIAELLAATDPVVAECRGVEEATVVSAAA
jgi:hypothetical protein